MEKNELRYAGLIRAVAQACEDSDGLAVELPYDVTVRMVEAIEELATHTNKQIEDRITNLGTVEKEVGTRVEGLEKKVNGSLESFEKRINDAGQRAFTDAKKLADSVRAHVERMTATEQIVIQLRDKLELQEKELEVLRNGGKSKK